MSLDLTVALPSIFLTKGPDPQPASQSAPPAIHALTLKNAHNLQLCSDADPTTLPDTSRSVDPCNLVDTA